MFIAVWAIALLLLACWSGFVWAAHALLTALLTHAGSLGTGDWQLPEPLAAWLPTELATWLAGALETLAPQLQALLGWVPALSGGVTVLGWLLWGLGAVPLLILTGLCHAALATWLRSRRAATPGGALA
ncbi:MAG: hypothetical protein ACK44A_14860 [Roseateles sp.]